MMAKKKTYEEIAEQAEKEDSLRTVSYQTKQDWSEGEALIGLIEDVNLLYFEEQDKPVIQYILDTDTGRTAVIFGRGVDKQISHVVRITDIIKAVFKGKVKLSNGHMMNQYEVNIVKSGDGPTISEKLDLDNVEPVKNDRDLPDNGPQE